MRIPIIELFTEGTGTEACPYKTIAPAPHAGMTIKGRLRERRVSV